MQMGESFVRRMRMKPLQTIGLLRNWAKEHAHAPVDNLTSPVPQFGDDIDALLMLTNFELPPLRVVRPAFVVQVSSSLGKKSVASSNMSCRWQR